MVTWFLWPQNNIFDIDGTKQNGGQRILLNSLLSILLAKHQRPIHPFCSKTCSQLRILQGLIEGFTWIDGWWIFFTKIFTGSLFVLVLFQRFFTRLKLGSVYVDSWVNQWVFFCSFYQLKLGVGLCFEFFSESMIFFSDSHCKWSSEFFW